MKLTVDFSLLKLAAAEMRGLDEYLSVLSKTHYTYNQCLTLAKEYVVKHGGYYNVNHDVVTLCLNKDKFQCFKSDRAGFEFKVCA